MFECSGTNHEATHYQQHHYRYYTNGLAFFHCIFQYTLKLDTTLTVILEEDLGTLSNSIFMSSKFIFFNILALNVLSNSRITIVHEKHIQSLQMNQVAFHNPSSKYDENKYHMSPNFHYSFKIHANHDVSNHQISIRVYNISIFPV